MGSTRRGFTPEYKDEAVKLVINTGRTVATVARELGLKEQTLGRWAHDFRARAAAGEAAQGGLSETERAELLRLRRRLSWERHTANFDQEGTFESRSKESAEATQRARGSRISNLAPWPGPSLWEVMVPPWASMIALLMVRPIPEPDWSRPRAVSPR